MDSKVFSVSGPSLRPWRLGERNIKEVDHAEAQGSKIRDGALDRIDFTENPTLKT
jgi:hypothetical protein